MMKRYQILVEYNICGNCRECLCNIPTTSGSCVATSDKNLAERRVSELNAIGIKARYEETPPCAWFDDENWIG